MAAATALAIASIASMAAGAGTSIYSAKKQNEAMKKAAKAAKEGQYLFSEQERAQARSYLTSSLFGRGGMGGMPQMQPPGGQRGGSPQEMQFAQFLKMVNDRYSRPSMEYKGFLEATQERRDARAGVSGVPPQGPADPSAQRRNRGSASGRGGGRSY